MSAFAKVIKREGFLEDFDSQKIYHALLKAGRATGEFGGHVAQNLTQQTVHRLKDFIPDRYPAVEQIQDMIEDVLMSSSYKKTAKAFIVYRAQHARLREIVAKLNVDLVDQYLQKKDWQVKENSNISFSLQGLNHYVSAEVSRTYWLNRIYPPAIAKAHTDGDFHIHDLGFLGAYCVGWDLRDLLMSGFQGSSGKIESRPAKHFRSALGQAVNFFYTLQGESAGAQAFSNFDTLLAPFIRYDGLTYPEVKQTMQEFLFNMNIPTRVGFQPPFTNVTLDMTVPADLGREYVIVGGQPKDLTYSEFQSEVDLLNKALLEIMLEGDAKGREFTFPILTYNITKDFDWDNPRLALLWELTAKYGTPYFANFITSDMRPEDARSMCCRLRIDTRELPKRGGGLFGASPLTGSIGVVTINMPRLGFLLKTEEKFLNNLSALMDLAKESLEIKRKVLEKYTDENLYPYMKFYLRDIKKRFGQYWKNHFSTIGLIGMNEACLNLFGENLASPKGHQFCITVLDFMRQRLIQYQEQTGSNYNLEATPAEGTSYRLAKIDKEKHPKIICANEEAYQKGHEPFDPSTNAQDRTLSKIEGFDSASPRGSTALTTPFEPSRAESRGSGRVVNLSNHEPFYTNSTHLPVNYSDDVFEVLDLQDDFQSRYTGGTVLHIFLGERVRHPDDLKSLIRMICTRYKLPYFTITPTFSVCPECGYLVGEHKVCTQCGQACEVFSRVVGYLRPVQQWNVGKQEEFQQRKVYKACA